MRKVGSFLLISLLALQGSLYSHSGGTNAAGCHNNRKTGDYHCHTAKHPTAVASGAKKPMALATAPTKPSLPDRAYSTKSASRLVVSVVDGDTLELSNGERVRLIGVDCPEFKDHARNKRNADRLGIDLKHYESFAQKAKDMTKKFVEGREVVIVHDDVNGSIQHKDKYGRTLAYVYDSLQVPDSDWNPEIRLRSALVMDKLDDGFHHLNINGTLIASGNSPAYTRFDFKYKDKFLELEAEAKKNRRGLWG